MPSLSGSQMFLRQAPQYVYGVHMTNPSLAIETHDLVKVFGKNRAVDGVDLAIPRGGVHGFLGPNGAGKTTTIRMLATLAKPDGGTARVLGRDVVTEANEVRVGRRRPHRPGEPAADRSAVRIHWRQRQAASGRTA
jgi:ABC-type uncharacterized transport system ATPase subunit